MYVQKLRFESEKDPHLFSFLTHKSQPVTLQGNNSYK